MESERVFIYLFAIVGSFSYFSDDALSLLEFLFVAQGTRDWNGSVVLLSSTRPNLHRFRTLLSPPSPPHMISAKQPLKTPTTPTSPSGPPSRVHTPTSQSPRPTSLVYSPGLLAAAMGVQTAVEEPPQVSKLEIREQARGVVDSWGTVVKTVLRNANVAEELGGAAKNFAYAESNIKSTQQSLEKINALLAQLHDRHAAALDHLRQVSRLQEALQMEELVGRVRTAEGRPRSRRAARAIANASAPATVPVAAGAGEAVAVTAGGGVEQ